MSWGEAVRTATIGLVVAVAVNATLAVIAGDTLVVPGELGLTQVVLFTAAPLPVLVVALRYLPRAVPVMAIVVALATVPVPFNEFGSRIGRWLAVMHVVAGAAVAVVTIVTRRRRRPG